MNNFLKKISLKIATLGPIGYLIAPGTVASLCSLIVIALLNFSCINYLIFSVCVVAVAFIVLRLTPLDLVHNDASELVIDEVVGTVITFLFIGLTPVRLVVGFLLFRFFDISKWFGVDYIQRLPGAYGVLSDDIAAGLLSNVVLQGLLYYAFI
ncbi:phosphatidylglycerophosphatase A [bacterium]|nr:phosphatidylglycerophosphatase A [bacterium]